MLEVLSVDSVILITIKLLLHVSINFANFVFFQVALGEPVTQLLKTMMRLTEGIHRCLSTIQEQKPSWQLAKLRLSNAGSKTWETER